MVFGHILMKKNHVVKVITYSNHITVRSKFAAALKKKTGNFSTELVLRDFMTNPILGRKFRMSTFHFFYFWLEKIFWLDFTSACIFLVQNWSKLIKIHFFLILEQDFDGKLVGNRQTIQKFKFSEWCRWTLHSVSSKNIKNSLL